MNKIELGWLPEKVIVRVVGKGCFINSRNFKEALMKLLEGNYDEIIIDLCDCKGMDSTFIGVLTGITLKNLKKRQKHIVLANISKTNRELLDTLGVLRFFEIDEEPSTFETNFESVIDTPEDPDDAISQIKHILEAHENLMKADEKNVERFKTVQQALEHDLADKIERKKKTEPKE